MSWCRRLSGRNQFELRLRSELNFHLKEQIREYVESGMSEQEARRRARQRRLPRDPWLCGTGQHKQQYLLKEESRAT